MERAFKMLKVSEDTAVFFEITPYVGLNSRRKLPTDEELVKMYKESNSMSSSMFVQPCAPDGRNNYTIDPFCGWWVSADDIDPVSFRTRW